MSTEIVLKVEKLSKSYLMTEKSGVRSDQRIADGKFHALEQISFELRKGDVLGVIGRNGSGKSTLLKILSQIIHPSSGSLSYNGRLMSILDIGSGFHPELSGRENAFMYGAMLGIPRREIQERIDQIIAFSGIGSYFDEPVKYYSNGMYLRVAFAVAFFTNTDILVLDEVLAVGDAEFMIKCHSRIREMIESGLSIILVSHSMSDIIGLCNKCLWLDKGRLIKYGHSTDVVAAYLQSGWGAFSSEDQEKKNSIMWPCEKGPGAEGVTILALKVENSSDNSMPNGILDYNLPLKVSIEYLIAQANQNISFVFILSDQYNTPIILSTHHFEQDDLFKESILDPGQYISHCIIPEKLLNVGAYKLQVRVIKDNFVEILDLHDLLFFRVESTFARQNAALRATPITLAPFFDWQTNKLS